jgi:serralysin
MFGASTATTRTTATSDPNINGLLSTSRWATTSQGNTWVSYSFTDSSTDYESNYSDSAIYTGFQSFNSTQRSATRTWANAYNNVSNLYLYELTGTSDRDATIRIAVSSKPNTAYGNYPSNFVEGGDVFVGTTYDYTNPTIGSYAYYGLGHELGHTLGLKHGNETDGVSNIALNSDRDSMEFSIMTYRSYIGASGNTVTNAEGSYAQSLMMYDIRAIQHLYGADFTYNASNTTYTFSTTTGEMFVNGIGQGTPLTNTIFRTIWDGNGIDTYDFSNYTTNLYVDLSPGGWSDLDTSTNYQAANLGNGNYARGQVFNALEYNNDTRSLIENASGGSGHDIIVGNSANNFLSGNDGYDYLYGGYGDDILYGGTGADTTIGDIGNDIYFVDNVNDVVTETANSSTQIDRVYSSVDYTLPLNVEELVMIDTVAMYGIGNNLNNLIWGNSNVNVLYGMDGNDFLYGAFGNDHLVGGSGADGFYFANRSEGVDTIYDFTAGVDKIYISAAGFGGGLVAGATINTSQFFTLTTNSGTSGSRLFFDADGYYGAGAAIEVANVLYNSDLTVNDVIII